MATVVPAWVQVETAIRSLVEFLPHGILLRVDHRLYVAAAAGHGLASICAEPTAPQEIIGQPLYAVMAPAVFASTAAPLRTALAGTAANFAVAAPDGGRLQLTTQPLPMDGGSEEHAALLFGVWDAGADEGVKQRLGVAVRAAQVGLWDLDVRTDMVHYSAEWKRQLGFEDDEIADTFEEWRSRLHPDDVDAALRNVRQFVAAHGSSYQHEFRLRHKDGSYRHILSQSTLQCDAAGQPVHLYGSHIDITERVQAEAALRASAAALHSSEEKFARFFHSSPIPLNVSQIYDGTFTDMNAAFVEQFGYSRAEALGRTPMELGLFGLSVLEKVRNIMVRDGRVHDVEISVTCKSGAVKHVLTSGVPLELPEGPHVLISNVDISALKHSAQQLRNSAEALKRSQAVAHVGHWSWDVQTGGVTWSDEMKRIFGQGPEMFGGDLNRLIAAAVHPDDAERVYAGIRTAVAEQRAVVDEYRVVLPDGKIRHVWAVAGEPVLDEQGNVVQIAGVVQDITERKHAEQVQMQLERQERLATVGQLAAGIAHDFNNTMSIISIYAELTSLAPGLTDKERARTLTIIDQAQRAAGMIRQILDFARQSVFERHTIDLLPLLKEQVKLFRQTLPENIEIALVADPGDYFVLADPTRMQQMVMNLVVNARDAMPDGGHLLLEVRHCTRAPDYATPAPVANDGEWLQLTVTDTGTGMSAEVLEHLYEPFFTTKAPGKGTGLGLPQVQGIVAQHKGTMAVTSTVGAGTTFHIFLPIDQPEIAAVSASVLPTHLPHGCQERILVVEDDAALRASVVDLLESWHYQVLSAGDGEEALALLGKCDEPVDLILSDVVMPRLGGIALVEKLRQQRCATPVILMSGHPIGEDRTRLEQGVISAWIDKPPSQLQLAEAIAAALARARPD